MSLSENLLNIVYLVVMRKIHKTIFPSLTTRVQVVGLVNTPVHVRYGSEITHYNHKLCGNNLYLYKTVRTVRILTIPLHHSLLLLYPKCASRPKNGVYR